MGLIKCPDCEKMFSDRIEACPHCGCPKAAAIAEINKTQANTDNQTTINGAPVVKVVLPEELTVKKRENIPIQRSQVIEVEQQSNEKLGMKWFNFITKVRPWIPLTASLILFLSLLVYIAAGEPEIFKLAIAIFLLFLVIIPSIVLQAWFLNKGYKSIITLSTIKSYLIWDIILGIPLTESPVTVVVYLILSYFVWYKCNMKYFRKRLHENNDDNLEIKSDSAEIKNLKFMEEATVIQSPSNQEGDAPSRTIRKQEKNRMRKKRITIIALLCITTLIAILGIIFIPKEYKYQKACTELNNSSSSVALAMFEELNGYRDSEDKIFEAKYRYILQHKNNDDWNTFAYLKELKSQDYKNTGKIYEDLYKWKVSDVVVNSSEDNETLHKTQISRSDPVYFHFRLTGGKPGEAITVRVKIEFPNGTSDKYTYNYEMTNGEIAWYGWENGIYELPEYGATGILECKFYDEFGILIGSATVRITE